MTTQKLSLRLGATLAVVGSLAAAPAASAGLSDVKDSVRGADDALTRVETLVASNSDAAAAVKLAKANALTRRADRQASKVRGAKRSARAARSVARQYAENAEVGIDSLPDVAASHQEQFVNLVDRALRGTDRAVATLTALLDRVPEQAAVGLAKAIAAIGQQSGESLEEVTAMIVGGEVSGEAAAALEDVVDRLESTLVQIQETLLGVIDRLPPQAQVHVQAALERVTTAIQQVLTQLEDLFANLPIGGLPFGSS